MKCLNNKYFQMFGSKLNKIIFGHLKDVGRDSETQLQVVEKLNDLI